MTTVGTKIKQQQQQQQQQQQPKNVLVNMTIHLFTYYILFVKNEIHVYQKRQHEKSPNHFICLE